MKIIRIIMGILTCMAVCASGSFAQGDNKTMMDILTSTMWKMEMLKPGKGDDGSYSKYEKDKVIRYSITEEAGYPASYQTLRYYFSDEIEQTFDIQKIGKSTSGKYLIKEGREYTDEQIEARLIEVMKSDGERRVIAGTRTEQMKQGEEHLKMLDEKYGSGKLVPIVFEIISLNEKELILKRVPVSSELIIGSGPATYRPYKGKL